ncbi:MAG: hypothetical protein HN929_01425 [Chloroflexi bacterium]|jgi:hypothetical protein|nr:hypothetical protein [Chloroflexota bacterium]MBT7080123.1 hypothetical protein [Chloroflexota bacterium]MBT7290201.1 hypothetical protein [Chloroflexota bacterium]
MKTIGISSTNTRNLEIATKTLCFSVAFATAVYLVIFQYYVWTNAKALHSYSFIFLAYPVTALAAWRWSYIGGIVICVLSAILAFLSASVMVVYDAFAVFYQTPGVPGELHTSSGLTWFFLSLFSLASGILYVVVAKRARKISELSSDL